LRIVKGGKEWGESYDCIFLGHVGSLLVWLEIAKPERMHGRSIEF
jgi:hypothetical protein